LAPQLIRVLLPKFLTSFPNQLVGYLNPTVQHHFLYVPIAQGKGVIEPDTVADDFGEEAVTEVHEPGVMS
jgi:hypothetical protein